jgi:hypothetical protein
MSCVKVLALVERRVLPSLRRALQKIIAINNGDGGVYIHGLLSINTPYLFLNKIEESNTIIGHQQIDCIHSTILLIENKNNEIKLKI